MIRNTVGAALFMTIAVWAMQTGPAVAQGRTQRVIEADRIIAVVNEEVITLHELRSRMAQVERQLRQQGTQVGGSQGAGGRCHGDRGSFLFWGTRNVQGLSDRSRGCTEVPSIPPCGGCIGACEPAHSAVVGAG